jgi:hypothetical protein
MRSLWRTARLLPLFGGAILWSRKLQLDEGIRSEEAGFMLEEPLIERQPLKEEVAVCEETLKVENSASNKG